MKRLAVGLVAVGLFALPLGQGAAIAQTTGAVTPSATLPMLWSHPANTTEIDWSSGDPNWLITGFDYDGSHAVTDGQSFTGVTAFLSTDHTTLRLTAYSDLSQSAQVADWFEDQTGGSEHVAGHTTQNVPSQLDFAFCGQLKFANGQSFKTCFARGDRWWIGGPQLESVSNPRQDWKGVALSPTVALEADTKYNTGSFFLDRF